MQVLLATCFDDAELQELKGLDGQYVRLDMDPLGNVSATAMEASQGDMGCIMPSACKRPSSACLSVWCLEMSKHLLLELAAHVQDLAEMHASVACA